MLPGAYPAYVLHSRPYKETSALVDLLTPEGRCRAVLRGARGRVGSVARPFMPLEVELKGRGDLPTASRIEAIGVPLLLQGEALFSGFYLNELLVRLLPAELPHPAIFEHYALTVEFLAIGRPLEPLLRIFEWRLLAELGFAFALEHDVDGADIDVQALYRLIPDAGLQRIEQLQPGAFLGADLLAMHAGEWEAPGVLLAAKRLMRQALAPHLGARPLVSRELFLKR